MGSCKNILAGAALMALLLSCGLPSYAVLDPPRVVDSDGSDLTLAFMSVSDSNYYVMAYKLYWYNETLISSDKAKINDEDEVELGFGTLEDLGFIQMKTTDETESNGDYPDSSTDMTVNIAEDTEYTVKLTFDTEGGVLSIENAENTDTLYRRAITLDSDGNTDDDNVRGIDFLSAEYDYQDSESYTASTSSETVTISGDSDGIDSDISDMFLKSSRFYYAGSSYDTLSIVIAVVAYSVGVDPSTMDALESIPVYLGTVKINPIYWYTSSSN